MTRKIVITADDFGLSRGITDSILETVDNGPVRRVSILANGEAVEYALQEYAKRKDHLELAVHLNLTEGKALSASEDVPHLVDKEGRFKHSVAGLWGAYLLSSQNTRNEYRKEIRQEIDLQIARILRATSVSEIAVNGHQHVHLLPFVADEIAAMPQVSSLRLVCEPSYFSGPFSPMQGIARPILRLLSHRAHVAAKAGNDWFVGFLYSGNMTIDRARRGLRRIPSGSVEVLFHPGSVREGELKEWKTSSGDLRWHTSPNRALERAELLLIRIEDLQSEHYDETSVGFDRVVRFIFSGGAAMGMTLAILYALTEFVHVWYLYSTMIAWCFGFFTSFMLQKFWTFEDSYATAPAGQAMKYFFLQAFNAVLNVAGMYLFVSILGVWYMFAQVLLGVVLALWTYVILRQFIFPNHIDV